MFDNLTPSEKNGELHKRTKKHAAQFANDGLRTLGVGQRFVTQDKFNKWKREIDALRLGPCLLLLLIVVALIVVL